MTFVPDLLDISKKGVSFDIYRRYSQERGTFFEISAEFSKRVQASLDLRISRRSMLERVFRLNRGDFTGLGDNFSVSGSNGVTAARLLTDPKSLEAIHAVLNYTKTIDFRSLTILRTQEDLSQLTSAMNSFAQLNELVESFLNRRYADYLLTPDEARRLGVATLDRSCLICRNAAAEDVFVLKCCWSPVHGQHIRMWLMNDERCSSCRVNLSWLPSI